MQISFEDKVALVTGAAMGVGLATAQAFAEAGAAVVLSDLDEAALRSATEQLRAAGHNVIGLRADVSSEADVAGLIDETVSKFGRLDAAFNNAGIQVPPAEIPDVPNDDYERVMAVNLRGVWNCMKHELRTMIARGSGAIVNCSSIGGLVGGPSSAAYHGAKHGVIGLTRSAGLENAARGIRVNAVCPGTIDTPMVAAMIAERPELRAEFEAKAPIKRFGRPDEIAAAVLWLCSDAASYVVATTLVIDGGVTAQ